MRSVVAPGDTGPLALEIFNDQFRGGSPKSIAVDGRRALVNLMDQVRRAEPAIALDVPAMPDRIKVAGIEFVEFAAAEQEAAELATTLRQLGRSEERRVGNEGVRTGRSRGSTSH